LLSSEIILSRLAEWREKNSLPIVPMAEETAREKLFAAGLTEEEIDAKKSDINPPHARILASYTDLHGLDRLREIDRAWASGIAERAIASIEEKPDVQFLRAVFQASEIALLNLTSLVKRSQEDIKNGDFDSAGDKQAWIDSFQHTLLELSNLAGKYAPHEKAERSIRFTHSPHLKEYTSALEDYHAAILECEISAPEEIGWKDLHDSGRRISFNAFNNETYESIWRLHMDGIPLPAIEGTQALDDVEFYKQFVGTDNLELAVSEVTQKGDNFFTQFRAYHQMSEIFCQYANRRFDAVICKLLDPGSNLMAAEEELGQLADALAIIEHNVHPILRNLTLNKYQDIRGSLGITSGSHSPNVRKGLFVNIYPLLVESVMYRLADNQLLGDGKLQEQLQKIVEDRNANPDAHVRHQVMKHVQDIHSTIRTWRDLHMQFVKTQIGASPMHHTASISGARNAHFSAGAMRYGGHVNEPAIPILSALNPMEYATPENPRDSTASTEFSAVMGDNTAKVIRERSAEIQDRVTRR
jgi:tryptophan 2,3-dioxygenase